MDQTEKSVGGEGKKILNAARFPYAWSLLIMDQSIGSGIHLMQIYFFFVEEK